MSPAPPEAFLLLSLANTTLASPTSTQSGVLGLQCVTIPIPEAYATSTATGVDRDVYLVLHLNSFEIPIDPSRVINLAISDSGLRTYTFHGTEFDPTKLVLTVALPSTPDPHFLEDIETFEGILTQYADLRGVGSATSPNLAVPTTGVSKVVGSGFPGSQGDLRGHLVLVNEDSGEVVGEFDNKFTIKEDPKLNEKGHENDPVIIEIPEESERDRDANAMEMFVRAVPPEQQDWITRSATVVSHAISHTTNLLLTSITSASSYYTSQPAPSSLTSPGASGSASPNPPPLPPRALVFLTSERTRKGLAGVHAVSGQAVKVSSKTVTMIDSMIRRAMGGKAKQSGRTLLSPTSTTVVSPKPGSAGSSPYLTPRTPSPTSFGLSPTPPAYSSSASIDRKEKPSLPPRRTPSPVHYSSPDQAPPLPPRTLSGLPDSTMPTPQGRLSTKERLVLSADLILSTLDNSARQILDVGTEQLGAVVAHKYGPDAAHSSLLLAGTARNIGLIYVDMRGIGRKALLKNAGKQFVKARASSTKERGA